MVPEIMVVKIMIKVIGFISTGKAMNQHFRGMGQVAYLADLTIECSVMR